MWNKFKNYENTCSQCRKEKRDNDKKNTLMETDCWKCDKKMLNIDVLKW